MYAMTKEERLDAMRNMLKDRPVFVRDVMKDRNREIALMPEFDSEEAFDAYFAEKTAAVAPYRDRQGRLVLDDIHDLPEVVEKVFAGHPEFTHTFFHEGN